jgi:hypothetical protein
MEEGQHLASGLWLLGVLGGPIALGAALVYGINHQRRRRDPPR